MGVTFCYYLPDTPTSLSISQIFIILTIKVCRGTAVSPGENTYNLRLIYKHIIVLICESFNCTKLHKIC